MRIGVMTFWWSEDNYGQLLQCYALQKYLRDLGHDAFLIRYRMKEVVPFGLKKKLIKYGLRPWRIFDGFRRIASRRRGREDLAAHDRKFGEFRDTYLKMSERIYHSIEELRAAPPVADMYIVGSDQVWRFDEAFRDDDVRAMLLDFGAPTSRRISYAASFGRTECTSCDMRLAISLIRRFTAVSVREQTGVGLCRTLGRGDAHVVCDPTILLNVNDYLKIAEMPRTDRKYVFCYMLTNDCGFKYARLKQWSDANDLDIIYVLGNTLGVSSYGDEGAERSCLTIPQWLGYLSKAEYVVTNSFHCCCLAAHFNRKTGVVMLTGKVAGMNTRLEALDCMMTSPVMRIEHNGFAALTGGVPLRFDPSANVSGCRFLNEVLTKV